MDSIPDLITQVDASRLAEALRYLAEEPLPCRTLNVTLPGHSSSTLDEADDYLVAALEACGYAIEREPLQVQAFRRDANKPLAHQYSRPEPGDPWYTAHNLYVRIQGSARPKEVILACAHKDSQSWFQLAPGAYDNAVGAVALLEIARLLAGYQPQRTFWLLWCNEEHTPWTSVHAAERLAGSGLEVTGVLNIDSLGGRAREDVEAGRLTNVTRYTTDEGEPLADLMATLNARYGLGLSQSKVRSAKPGDDDGSFIKAGIPWAVCNLGSLPYTEPNYHTVHDVPAAVDMDNVRRATQLSLAFLVHLDRFGRP